jgi:hypothetical protein
MAPNTDRISVTFPEKYVSAFLRGDQFALAVAQLDAAKTAGEIYNPEFQAAKSNIASGCEHAQHIAAGKARQESYRNLPSGDIRHDIGYAFGMNQAAKLSRGLKKLPSYEMTPELMSYIATLDQINEWFLFLKSLKPIIKKGRKPAENAKPVDVTNTGICPICEGRFKLEKHGGKRMVHHGFRISDGYGHYFGHRSGKCFGTGYEPYELSNQANKEYKYFLEQERKDCEKYIADLTAFVEGGVPSSVYDTLDALEGFGRHAKRVTYERGTQGYETERVKRITKTKGEINWLDTAIPYQQARIDGWSKKPLIDEQ